MMDSSEASYSQCFSPHFGNTKLRGVMALQGTAKEARAKRKEQLRLWEESEANLTNSEDSQSSRPRKAPRVKFNKQCMFLAACSAGDKEEVERLLESNQADINTRNVDGLTALHQACIDNNIEMVEFLIDKGIDLNIGDNEGWTPLHATASCGYVSIAQLLLERGARLDIVNVDNELPVDRAEETGMKKLLEQEAKNKGIDEEAVRQSEQKVMLEDIKVMLENQRKSATTIPSLVVDSKTGATALHVAAAKGYTDVIHMLIKERQDIHAQDADGWTPLHAAAHWEQKEACGMLVKEGLADLECVTFAGQTVADVCDEALLSYIDELKGKRPIWLEERKKMIEEQRDLESPPHEVVTLSLPPPHVLKRRTSVTRMSGSDRIHLKDASAERISASIILSNPIEEEPSVEATIDLPPPLPRSNPPSQSNSTVSTPSSSTNASVSATLSLSSQNSTAGVKRSFVAPIRDEESETQRKAHAKRVRETRRSTQGVSLEDIKSAEEKLRSRNLDNGKEPKATPASEAATTPSSMDLGSDSSLERRTSWRERAAAEQRQRQIEDAPHLKIVDSIEAVQHHQSGDNNSSPESDDKPQENNDDKENSELTTQPRRRRSKRRFNLTGTPSTDDLLQQLELNNDKTRSKIQDLDQQKKAIESEHVGSSLDYKKLYETEQSSREALKKDIEAAQAETERLRELLSEKDEKVLEIRKNLEAERTRRLEAEKNLKDIQSEIKNVDTLKKKIEQMQEENAALIRVISKLSINNHK